MTIAINTRNLSGDAAATTLMVKIFSIIADCNPGHQFVFITAEDKSYEGSNIKTVVIKQQSRNTLLWQLWYNYKLPSALKKINAGILVSAGGACPLRLKLPQWLLVEDEAVINPPEWYSRRYRRFTKSFTPLCLQKAAHILCFTGHTKTVLIDRYKTDAQKISVVHTGADKAFGPIDQSERELVKEKYAGGKEYFFFCGAAHTTGNLLNLLKAFSLFKKRQKSNMQFVLAITSVPEKDTLMESTRLYKYRNELNILPSLPSEELHLLTAAAWCCINLSPLVSDIHFLQNAIHAAVPVIAGNSAAAKELLKDHALYADASLPADIAGQLMLVYKDEPKRNGLVQSGIAMQGDNTLEKTAALIWENIAASFP